MPTSRASVEAARCRRTRRRGREVGGSDPDEFFRQFPGGFLFFPVVTSGGGVAGLQTIRSKIFTANPNLAAAPGSPRHAGRGGGGAPDARNGRGLLAETHKPIRLSALQSLRQAASPVVRLQRTGPHPRPLAARENILRRPDVYLRSGLYLYFRVGTDSGPELLESERPLYERFVWPRPLLHFHASTLLSLKMESSASLPWRRGAVNWNARASGVA